MNFTANRKALGIILFFSLAHFFILQGNVYDDAFIFFRYARHIAQGHGAVFNLNDAVEGFSSPLWLMLQLPAVYLGISPTIWVTLLGFLAYVTTFLALFYTASEWLSSKKETLLFLVAALSFSPFVFWSVTGLETVFFSCLLASAYTFCLAPNKTRNQLVLYGILLGCVSLARTEGIAYTSVFLIYSFFTRDKKDRFFYLLPTVSFSLFLSYLAFRYWTYGYLLPNTYYAKVGYNFEALIRGYYENKNFLFSFFVFPQILILIVGWTFYWQRKNTQFILLVTLLLTGLVLGVLSGGNNLPFWRYQIPLFPFLCFFMLFYIQSFKQVTINDPWKKWIRNANCVYAFIFIINGLNGVYLFSGSANFLRTNLQFHKASHFYGKLLKEYLPEGSSVALNAIPFFSYYYEGPVIDMLGLVDRTIAHREIKMGTLFHGHEKGDGRYVLAQLPTAIIWSGGPWPYQQPCFYPTERMMYYVSEKEIISHTNLQRLYSFKSIKTGDRYFCLFVKKDTPVKTDFLPKFWEENKALITENQEINPVLVKMNAFSMSLNNFMKPVREFLRTYLGIYL